MEEDRKHYSYVTDRFPKLPPTYKYYIRLVKQFYRYFVYPGDFYYVLNDLVAIGNYMKKSILDNEIEVFMADNLPRLRRTEFNSVYREWPGGLGAKLQKRFPYSMDINSQKYLFTIPPYIPLFPRSCGKMNMRIYKDLLEAYVERDLADMIVH
jgi:hypothetical protein